MTNLPAELQGLDLSNMQASAEAADTGGGSYILFTKFGEWLMDKEPIDGLWAVHPVALRHGWIAWGNKELDTEGELVGEVMCPASQLTPLEADLNDVKGKWTRAVGMTLACIDGDARGSSGEFKSNSAGGRGCYAKVVREMVARINSDNEAVVPVISLGHDSYIHKKHGKIFTPVMEVEEWLTFAELGQEMEGPKEAAPEPIAPISDKPKKRNVRRLRGAA